MLVDGDTYRTACSTSMEGTACAMTTLPPLARAPVFTYHPLLSSTKVTVNLRDGQGTKENEYCSNHGVCDFETGTCVCDRNTTQFPNDWYWWESSDGYGGSGARGDCGYQRQESATNVSQSCPVGIVFSNETMPMYETMDQVNEGNWRKGTW